MGITIAGLGSTERRCIVPVRRLTMRCYMLYECGTIFDTVDCAMH